MYGYCVCERLIHKRNIRTGIYLNFYWVVFLRYLVRRSLTSKLYIEPREPSHGFQLWKRSYGRIVKVTDLQQPTRLHGVTV